MPDVNVDRRFIFHGSALPFGGRITKRQGQAAHETISGAPASALSVAGGKHRATSRGSSYLDVFRWGSTLAHSEGEHIEDGSKRTTVTCSVADVYALNNPLVFEADLLKLTLVADHPEAGEPSIVSKEVVFGGTAGMTLDGEPIELKFDNDLEAFPTFALFEKEYQTNQAFFDKYQASITAPNGPPKFGDPLPRTSGGYVHLSFVQRVRYKKKWRDGNVLSFKGFGSIHFGEVLMKENNRRVTMVRLAMGSDTGADVTICESDPNGQWLP